MSDKRHGKWEAKFRVFLHADITLTTTGEMDLNALEEWGKNAARRAVHKGLQQQTVEGIPVNVESVSGLEVTSIHFHPLKEEEKEEEDERQ